MPDILLLMAKHRINWLKVAANSGYIFFWMLVGFFSADTMFNLHIPFWEYVKVCTLIAFVNAGAVFCLELRTEAEDQDESIAQKEETVGDAKSEETEKDNPGKKGKGGNNSILSLLYVF